jgi:hypothetical protein
MHLFRLITSASIVLLAPTAAIAQNPGTSPPPGAPPTIVQPARDGILFGFGVGGGHMSCESSEDVCDGVTEAGGIDLHLGYMLRPRIGLVFEIWPMGHTEDNVTITHVITTIGAQIFVLPRLWLKGGVGHARASWHYKNIIVVGDETENVPAIMGAVGYEVLVGRRFAMDVQLRGGTGFYEEQSGKASNVAVQLGFTWY